MSKQQKQYIVISSALLIAVALLFIHLGISGFGSDVLMTAAAGVAGYPIAKKAYMTLRMRVLGIESLVTVAVFGALAIGEFWEAAAVTFLFVFGSWLEARALEKTRSSLKSLLDLQPQTASVLRDGEEVERSPDQVNIGEIVRVRPGEKIPVDGVIQKGRASVNQAAITGESIPVGKDIGDEVFSGTILESGYLELEARKVGEDTTFSHILELVEEAQDEKARTQQFLEKFSRYYTPGIMITALVVFLITFDVRLSLTLLVIACPGALVISAPVSIVSGIGNGARNGVLIKGGEILEQAGKVGTIAFDKTGTLTRGEPSVTGIKTFGMPKEQLLYLAGRAEAQSEHHLGKAVVHHVRKVTGQSPEPADAFNHLPGLGLSAEVDGQMLHIGNCRLMEEEEIAIPGEIETYLHQEEEQGKTPILVAVSRQIQGVISIADRLRNDARELIKQLYSEGFSVVMLTGDNARTAASIAHALGIDEYYAELLPADKVDAIRRLQFDGQTVAMVGDGVNDAPALATADLGIAMGGAGTDAAMETADIVLMADQLSKVSYSLGISKATVRNMKQNIYFAVAVVLLLILGVLTGNVFLAGGMMVHEASVLLVIINAIRLLGYGSEKPSRQPLFHHKKQVEAYGT